jgi:8-oxo-dGTP pyrophosphatase MutT (NUDIX family)
MVAHNAPRQELPDLLPEDSFLGTSLILREPQVPLGGGDRLLYGIRPARPEGSRLILELTGIGGAMEEEDGSLTAGALREAWEEMGCSVRLLPCDETIIVRGPNRVERIALHGQERPAAVVFRHYGTPPHQPWHPSNQGEICIVVFLAELSGEPHPAMELAALVWLRPEQLGEVAGRDVAMRALLDGGAELVERAEAPLPETAWMRLTDSQEALAVALGGEALAFYKAMLKA